jgi:hypothetical protein
MQQGSWLISVTTGKVFGTWEHFTYTRRIADRGRTWEPRVKVCDGKALGVHMDCEMGQRLAVLAPLGNKQLTRNYQFHIIKDASRATRFGSLAYTYSEDDGRTWLGPAGPNSVYLIDASAYALAPAKDGWHLMAPGLIMSNGEWLLPIAVSTDPRRLADIRAELVCMTSPNNLYETDPAALVFEFWPAPPHGLRVPLEAAPGESLGHEPQVVELATPEHLMCVARTGNGYIAYSTSTDYAARPGDPQSQLSLSVHPPDRRPLCPSILQ